MGRINELPEADRPVFPKRAVVTAGMPNGNKEMYFHHIGGVFIHADTYARFLRDRLGRENVIFVSGTDCYGSPAFEQHRQLASKGEFSGTIEEFAEMNYIKQKAAIDAYNIDINLFAASALGRSREIHEQLSKTFIEKLYTNGHLIKISTTQFYDKEHDTYLNGRQVIGKCPVAGCSGRGYADECANGHQYMPAMLIDPISTISGNRPEEREVINWYIKLTDFKALLQEWLGGFKTHPTTRAFAAKSIQEFLEPPVIYIKKDQMALLPLSKITLPRYHIRNGEDKGNTVLEFDELDSREKACSLLSENNIRYRTGKTLVPFRLTGNIKWGVIAPPLEGLDDRTVWVWPESLWAPISFTMTYLEKIGAEPERWKDWWCSPDAKVYQFLGIDNIYFYGPAEMAMFMGYNAPTPNIECADGQLQLPELIVNNHLLFMNKKSSSSDEIKPPTALSLLERYTAEQLRVHFLSLGLSLRSVSFQPKTCEPAADASVSDPVLKEGNLLTNVFNRFARTCFYTSQKYFGGKIPFGDISSEVLDESVKTVLAFEKLMYSCGFHSIMALMDAYVRGMNKYASKHMREADINNDEIMRKSVLINMFHMLRTATALMHPIAPEGTERVCAYLNLDRDFWSWDNIFKPIYYFIGNTDSHRLKFLEPRTDFFIKHPSQLEMMRQDGEGE